MHFDGREPVINDNPAPPSTATTPATAAAVPPRRLDRRQPTTSSLLEELTTLAQANNADTEIRPVTVPPANPYRIEEGSFLSLLQSILFYPFTLSYKVVNSIFYFLSTLFPFLPRLTGYYPANRTATHSVQKVYDPKDTAVRVIRAFEETYGQTGLKFFEGGFAQAFEAAKQDLKFLIVVLQSDEHDLTAPFNRQVLTDPRVVEFLNRNDTIVWLGNVENSEGFQIAESLKCTTFPYVLLVAPAPKAPNSSVVIMKSLVSIQGEENDPMHFVSTLEEKIESHVPIRATLVHDKEEREMDRRLREQQNEAYERSLAADRERARIAKEEKMRAELEAREQKAREEEAAHQEAERQRKEREWKLWRLAQLGPEHVPSSAESSERAARISVRTYEGDRLIRKFSGMDTVESVYAFVECHKVLEELGPEAVADLYAHPESYPKPDGYQHEYKFQLASTMPRRVIDVSEAAIKSDSALWPSGSLVVEIDLDSEEEE